MHPRTPQLNRIVWIAALAYALLAILIGIADVVFMLQHHTGYPFGDHWGWLARFWERGLWGALIGQYNEHRFFFPGMLYWADLRFFGARNNFLTLASAAIHVACLIALAVPMIRTPEVPRSMRVVFFGFVTIVMLWYIQGPNFFYPYNLCIPFANLDILVALYLFAIFYQHEALGGQHAGWLLAGSILFGFAATFTYGHGILIWPLLLLNAFILRLHLRRWVPILLTGLLASALYFRHYISPPGHANPIESLHKPLKLAAYFVLMIGLPWLGGEGAPLGFRPNVLRYGVILSGLALAAFFIVRFGLRRVSSKHEIFYSSLLLLTTGSAAITALSRINFPITQSLSARYAPIPLLFWISLLALLTVELCRFESAGGAGRFLWCIGLVALSAATLPTQFVMGPYMESRAKLQDAAVVSLALGIPDPQAIGRELHPNLALLRYVDQQTMKNYHRPSLFEIRERRWLGTPFGPQSATADACQSSMDDPRIYGSEPSRGVCFSGWLFDRKSGLSARRILITDQAGTVLGLGIGAIPRPDVAAAFQNSAMGKTGWNAYLPLPRDGTKELRIFGQLESGQPGGGSALCEVQSPKILLP